MKNLIILGLFVCCFVHAEPLTDTSENSLPNSDQMPVQSKEAYTGHQRDFYEKYIERITEQSPFLRDTKLRYNVRVYYLNRNYHTSGIQESLAAGACLDYESGSWHGLSIGLTPYTSQKIYSPSARDGANLLAAGQKGYTVLGKAFLQAKISKTLLRLYRQELQTPLINPYDVKMTPVTVEAYTIESRDIPHLMVLASHVTGIKGWTDTAFISMSEAAGFKNSNKPVTLAGLVYTPTENYTVQIWEYLAYDFMNAIYFQADGNWKLKKDLSLFGSIQAIDEINIGKAMADEFHTGMAGVKSGLTLMGATFALGFTKTANDRDIVNPWGSYPGFTSIMEEDCDLAGENAWLLELAFDFERIGLKGLSAFADYTDSYTPDTGQNASPDQREYNLTIDYHFSGKLKGLWLRLRGAIVDQSKSLDGKDYSDCRVIINYDFLLL